MFTKTRNRIYRTLLLIAAILIALILVPSIAVFSGMFRNTYGSMAKNKLDRSISAGRMYIDSIMSTTDNLALDPAIIGVLDGTQTVSLTAVLDAACAYSHYINAITVYGTDGKIYTSSGVLNPPSAQDLRQKVDIAEFFADEEANEYVSLRTSCIIKAYSNVPYDEQLGIISCCRKVFSDSGEVIGYIFSDVFPQSLFEYFNFAGDPRLSGSIAIVLFDGGNFMSEHTPDAEKYLTATTDSVVGGKLIVSSIRNFYGGTIRIAVPIAPLNISIALISCILSLCGAVLLCATHFIARETANSVTERLNGLLLRMTLSAEKFSNL